MIRGTFPRFTGLIRLASLPGFRIRRLRSGIFLSLRSANCIVAMVGAHLAGFILTEENPPVAH
jgi:hypothetical protein